LSARFNGLCTPNCTNYDYEQQIFGQTDPTYEIAYYNLGKVYQKQRKWDKAAESFGAAVEPGGADCHRRSARAGTSRASRSHRWCSGPVGTIQTRERPGGSTATG